MTRKLKPNELPGWPRRMGADMAAAYMGVSPSLFLRRVMEGRYPRPIKDGRLSVWDKVALDSLVDAQFGSGEDSGSYESW